MKFLNFTKNKDTADLELKVSEGNAVKEMTKTNGWNVIKMLLEEQFKAYQADVLLGCKDWSEYQEKRGKAFAIRLLLTDIDDFVRQGEEAKSELDKIKG